MIETTGKTIDAAINAALEQLGTDRDSVTVEVLENPKTGFLGLGGTPARVLVKRLDDLGEKPGSAAKSAPKPAAKPSPKSAPKSESKPKSKPAAPAKKKEPRVREADTGVSQPNGDASEILKGILDRMGITGAAITQKETERGLLLEVSGSNMGRLIGKRGETLDAVQRILSSSVNKGGADWTRIIIDVEKYRAKRNESLEALARSTADKVVRYNRDMLLEPMNAYSRHVIHLTLQDNPYVTTHSVGNEPQRRVIISLSGAKKTAPPRRENP
jgi:spoIIIJ-associated protein